MKKKYIKKKVIFIFIYKWDVWGMNVKTKEEEEEEGENCGEIENVLQT